MTAFLTMNAGASVGARYELLPEERILLGHKKGAFTSAGRDHFGWFQQADLGTLFLDEIGELGTLRIDWWEQKLIRDALKRTRNSVPKSAELLGVSRATLYRKIEEYEIER